MKVLRVGDPHVQVKNIKDCEKLKDFIIATAVDECVDVIEFLGDLFHTHAVVRVEVINFWREAFREIGMETATPMIALCGNHDQPGSKEKEQLMNSLISLKGCHPLLTIVDKPTVIHGIAYVPYYSNEEEFLKACQDLFRQGATSLLVAHQTFTGAQYENGFFSKEGIDPALVPQEQIVSGHIHKSQQVGKCFYPGTPKWDTMADANQEKGIWIFEHNSIGGIESKRFVNTKDIVTPITSYEVKEGEDLPELDPKARNYITLEGKSVWITKTKKKLKGLANIKVKPTDRAIKIDRNNSVNIETYLEKEFVPIEGINKQDIKVFLEGV